MEIDETETPKPPLKSTWRDCSHADREAWRKDFFINHTCIKGIFTDFLVRLAHCESSNAFQAMLVIGGTGAGKTRLTRRMREFAGHRYQKQDDEKSVRPVIQFAIPDPCTPLEISVEILRALGEVQPRARKSKADTILAAEHMLRACETRLVLLDNLQDVPERRGARGIELVGARLRNLMDASAALWVLFGTDDAKRVINGNTQLIRRVPYCAQLRYFGISNSQDRQSFRRLLHEVDQWLPLAEPSCLLEPALATKMYFATEGVFDRIMRLLDDGWKQTVQAGRETLQVEDLACAFGQVFGPHDQTANPFAPGFVPRRLNKAGEPFETLQGGDDVDTTPQTHRR